MLYNDGFRSILGQAGYAFQLDGVMGHDNDNDRSFLVKIHRREFSRKLKVNSS